MTDKKMKLKIIPRSEYLKSLPRKRMAAGMIFMNEKKELLMLKSDYKDYWSIAGGVIEKNESPLQAAIRETKEEINIDVKQPRLLIIDYVSPKGNEDDNIVFIFYGGVLVQEDIDSIKLQEDEIEDYKFITEKDLKNYTSAKYMKRIPLALNAIKNNTTFYLEDGERI